MTSFGQFKQNQITNGRQRAPGKKTLNEPLRLFIEKFPVTKTRLEDLFKKQEIRIYLLKKQKKKKKK